MTTTEKRLDVTVTAYEGDVEFPEAEHYPEFVAARLTETFGAAVEVSVGDRTRVFAYGFGDNEEEVARDAKDALQVGLWDEFCAHGYKEFSQLVAAKVRELVAAVALLVGDDGTGDLGVIVREALAQEPGATAQDIAETVREARRDAAQDRA